MSYQSTNDTMLKGFIALMSSVCLLSIPLGYTGLTLIPVAIAGVVLSQFNRGLNTNTRR